MVRLVEPAPTAGTAQGPAEDPPGERPPDKALPDRPFRPSARARRWGALALAAVLGDGAAQLQQAQEVSREERRLAGTLSLEAEPFAQGVEITSGEDGSVAVSVPILLRNTGSRPVTLRSAEVADLALRAPRVDMRTIQPAGETRAVLRRGLSCPADLPRTDASLRVTATTQGGDREVSVPVDATLVSALQEQLHRYCGIVPVPEALDLVPQGFVVREDGLVVTILVINRSAREARIKYLLAPKGLRAQALGRRGRPEPLPILVPPGDRHGLSPRSYDVRISLVGGLCTIAAQAGPELLDITYSQEREDVTRTLVDQGGELRRYVDLVCP